MHRPHSLKAITDSHERLAMSPTWPYRSSYFRRRYERWLGDNADAFTLLEIGGQTASHCADIRNELRAADSPIPVNDVWVAALARGYRLAVLTLDRHFAAVSGIRVRAWRPEI